MLFSIPDFDFDPTFVPSTDRTGHFPHIRRVVRFAVAASLKGAAYFAVAFGLVSGVLLAIKVLG